LGLIKSNVCLRSWDNLAAILPPYPTNHLTPLSWIHSPKFMCVAPT